MRYFHLVGYRYLKKWFLMFGISIIFQIIGSNYKYYTVSIKVQLIYETPQEADTFGPNLGYFWHLWLRNRAGKCCVGPSVSQCSKTGPDFRRWMTQMRPKFHKVMLSWETANAIRMKHGPKAQRKWRTGPCLVDMYPSLGSYTHLELMSSVKAKCGPKKTADRDKVSAKYPFQSGTTKVFFNTQSLVWTEMASLFLAEHELNNKNNKQTMR